MAYGLFVRSIKLRYAKIPPLSTILSLIQLTLTHDFTPQSQLMTKLWPRTRTFKTYCGQLNEFRSLISTGAPDNEIFSIIDYISGHSSVAQLPYRLYLI